MLSCKHQNHLGTNWHEVKQRLVEVKDPIAMCQMGLRRYYEGDYNSAFEYTPKQLNWEMWERVMNCHVCMGRGKVLRGIVSHLKEAVIAGCPGARHNLGYMEWNNGRIERAVKHFIIAANLGRVKSIEMLKLCYRKGLVSVTKILALRAHQAAIDATKSPHREAAEAQQRR